MATISQVIEKIIEENPFIEDILSKEIINYVSFA